MTIISTTSHEHGLRMLFAELSAGHPLFKAMEQTVEDSPWHREANVLIHTEMVLEEYITMTNSLRQGSDWLYEDWLGGVSCIFHDVGKPSSRTPKYSEKRGNYFAYHGHEQVSARLFEDWAVTTNAMSPEDIFMVEWMIFHHMPWTITDPYKLATFKATCLEMGGDEMLSVYLRALLADQFGRLSDDKETNSAASRAWVSNLLSVEDVVTPKLQAIWEVDPAERKYLILPIGPSGAGKSTLSKQYPDYNIFSLDALRHEYYHPTDYSVAYAMSTEDSTFANRANTEFLSLIKQGNNVYVDNTNLSLKRRAFYISEARKRGYTIIAVHLLSTIDTLIARQGTRLDKTVPSSAVKQQYMSLYAPSIGEVDQIFIR